MWHVQSKELLVVGVDQPEVVWKTNSLVRNKADSFIQQFSEQGFQNGWLQVIRQKESKKARMCTYSRCKYGIPFINNAIFFVRLTMF